MLVDARNYPHLVDCLQLPTHYRTVTRWVDNGNEIARYFVREIQLFVHHVLIDRAGAITLQHRCN